MNTVAIQNINAGEHVLVSVNQPDGTVIAQAVLDAVTALTVAEQMTKAAQTARHTNKQGPA